MRGPRIDAASRASGFRPTARPKQRSIGENGSTSPGGHDSRQAGCPDRPEQRDLHHANAEATAEQADDRQ